MTNTQDKSEYAEALEAQMTNTQDMPLELYAHWTKERVSMIAFSEVDEDAPRPEGDSFHRYILPGISPEEAREALEFLEQYEHFYVKHPHQIPYIKTIRTLLERAVGGEK